MDTGLITIVLLFMVLVIHIAFDARSLLKNLRGLKHSETSGGAACYNGAVSECELCHTKLRGKHELRHEAAWAVAALIILIIHIAGDFVRLG